MAVGLIHQDKSIDMPSQGNRSISKVSVTPTWIPKGSCSFAAGRGGRHRRGRWHGVVAYRVSRAR